MMKNTRILVREALSSRFKLFYTDEPICREETETEMERTSLWTQRGEERAGKTEDSIGTNTPPRVTQTASGQVLCRARSSAVTA